MIGVSIIACPPMYNVILFVGRVINTEVLFVSDVGCISSEDLDHLLCVILMRTNHNSRSVCDILAEFIRDGKVPLRPRSDGLGSGIEDPKKTINFEVEISYSYLILVVVETLAVEKGSFALFLRPDDKSFLILNWCFVFIEVNFSD